ncbi:hypothetical protein [Streptomyces sp. NPDC088847]|uniref:hypothetical protein n=1 Tax=Streptomyces sp. NPDC088847 TaxID=3365909 RepID=UPI0038166A74
MTEVKSHATELTSQYTARVAGDLERIIEEQEFISAEIEALQKRASALEHDHTVLMRMQQALSCAPSTDTSPPPFHPAVTAYKPPTLKKTSAGAGAKVAANTRLAKADKTVSPRLTLVAAIRSYLGSQDEPRSAAEIASVLAQVFPDRTVKTTVVRTTLEGLVAKNRAERIRQGFSVFYTALGAEETGMTEPGQTPSPE